MDLFGDLFGFGIDDLPVDGFGAGGLLDAFSALNDMIYYVGMLGFSIFLWILQSRGLYAIARRRAIRHPWLSWVPIVRCWITGCISDQYRYVVKGEIGNKRKWLPILSGAVSLLLAVTVGYAIAFGIMILPAGNATQGMLAVRVSTLGYVGLLLLLIGAAVLRTVLYYKALYDLYASCDPGKRILYLLLSIFLSIEAFFVSACRDKDLGMPSRKCPA